MSKNLASLSPSPSPSPSPFLSVVPACLVSLERSCVIRVFKLAHAQNYLRNKHPFGFRLGSARSQSTTRRFLRSSPRRHISRLAVSQVNPDLKLSSDFRLCRRLFQLHRHGHAGSTRGIRAAAYEAARPACSDAKEDVYQMGQFIHPGEIAR